MACNVMIMGKMTVCSWQIQRPHTILALDSNITHLKPNSQKYYPNYLWLAAYLFPHNSFQYIVTFIVHCYHVAFMSTVTPPPINAPLQICIPCGLKYSITITGNNNHFSQAVMVQTKAHTFLCTASQNHHKIFAKQEKPYTSLNSCYHWASFKVLFSTTTPRNWSQPTILTILCLYHVP